MNELASTVGAAGIMPAMTGTTSAISAVLFDLDNTLVERDRGFAAWAAWFARERLGLTGKGAEAAVARLVALDVGGYGAKAAMFGAVKERYPALAEEVGALVAAFREELPAHLPPLEPAASGLLAALDAASVPWGIVTNGSAGQLLKLSRLGLDGRTPCMVVSEVLGWRKPAPEIFLAAASALGADPSAILFVGDNPEADVVGAAGVGMRTAWLRRGRVWPAHLAAAPPTFVVDSLAELGWPAARRR